MTASIRFENVSKWFTLFHQSQTLQERMQSLIAPRAKAAPTKEQFWALKNVTFSVEKGQTVGLVGSNGSGKSTALKMVAQILEPTSGSITVNGRISALLELGAGFHPDLTGRDNVYLNGSLLGIGRKRMNHVFDQIVEYSELQEFIDMPVKHYSSGMYTRLAFAVAIHVEPEILLVDEVLAVGDGAFQRKCMESIAELRRDGVTILLVSHDLETVARLCHTVVWLDKGAVHAIGGGRIVINDYISFINEQEQATLERTQRLREERQQAEETTKRDDRSGEDTQNKPAVVQIKEAEITGIETLDKDGNNLKSILTGDPLCIRVHYTAHRPIETPVFGLALHRDDGAHVTGPNTQSGNYPIAQIDGDGYIDYRLDSVPLTAGRFFISASLVDKTCTLFFDYSHQAHSFVVQPRTGWDSLGIVKLNAEWQLSSKPSLAKEHRNRAGVRPR